MRTVLRKIVEMVLLFAGLMAADHYHLAPIPFVQLQPSPYWLPVIALSLAYGSGLGLVACVIASVIWVESPHQWPASYDHLAIQLRLSMLPLMWAVCALVIGEVTASRQRRLKALNKQCADLGKDSDKLAKALTKLSKINRDLQVGIATSKYVAGEPLMAASGLLVPGQPDQRLALAKLISLALRSDDFTYYGIEGHRLVVLLTGAGPHEGRQRPPAVLWSDGVAAKSDIVHVEQKLGRDLLEGVGIAAIPVMDPDDHSVVALLVVHSAPFLRFNPARLAELRHLGHALFDYAEVFAKPMLQLADSQEDRVA